ncbi:hypothetical protein [Oligoflexus tunisiensis]|uniref:hypothetical protein n=1 Tax=Oligoflexus tunisiensis TaxID=708132 RepID=UPI00114CF366|nr:hypothetical protein [Oligoflexus tunisiensis]
MKCRIFVLLVFMVSSVARSETAAADRKVPLESLIDRSIAYVKRPSIVEWRKRPFILNIELGQFIEYNNFESSYGGIALRLPSDSFVVKSTLVDVKTYESEASRQIGKTPFQQTGRPSRLEWQNGIEVPILEGIGNPMVSWVPASQFVLSSVAQVNSHLYSNAVEDPVELFTRFHRLNLSDDELRRLQEHAPPSMRILRSRHSLGFGLQWDNYYRSGINWNTRFLYEMPMASPDRKLKAWYSLTLGVGYAS